MAQQFIDRGAAPNDGTGDPLYDAAPKINDNFTELYAGLMSNVVVVNSAADLLTIDSTKTYLINGNIDMGSQTIEIPSGGISITGYDFTRSKIFSTANSFSLFTSPVGGSGNVLIQNIAIDVSGTSSQVYDIVGDTGSEAIEVNRVNYENCTSLGTIDTYRQGLESGTGRFGATPRLTLAGTWLGGFRISTSIARNITDGATGALFQAGVGLVLNSRFITNMNADLGSTMALIDFAPSNINGTQLLQLNGAIITRNGVSDASDTTLYPNIDHTDVQSYWKNNRGLPNTQKGGELNITATSTTTINTVNVWENLAGTFTIDNEEHFDSPVNGQLRYLDDDEESFSLNIVVSIDGTAGNNIELRSTIFRDETSTFEPQKSQLKQINSFQGPNDRAFFTIIDAFIMRSNDYVKLEVRNTSNTNNVTAEIDSYFIIDER